MDDKAFRFWQRIDSLNKDGTLLNLCRRSGVDYNRVKHNRSDCRIPKADDLLLLSRGVGRSIEFLLTGEDHQGSALPPEARAVMEDDALRTLVRYCMEDRRLLSAIELIIERARADAPRSALS